MDYPGIDDATDTKKIFMRVFENNFNNADIVVYVTDATTAFRDASEVESFNKIKQTIDNFNSNGEYIDLIILANKFDDEDEDLEQIFSEIATKTKIHTDKIFKFSSHKTLIMNIIVHQTDLYVPTNDKIKKELQKIMKNTCITLSPCFIIDGDYLRVTDFTSATKNFLASVRLLII